MAQTPHQKDKYSWRNNLSKIWKAGRPGNQLIEMERSSLTFNRNKFFLQHRNVMYIRELNLKLISNFILSDFQIGGKRVCEYVKGRKVCNICVRR